MQVLGHFLFLAVSCFITGLLCLFLAILVLNANPKSRGCRLAFLLNLFVSFWAFSFGSMLLAKNDALGLWVAKILTVNINFLNTFFTHLVIHVTKKEKSWNKFLILNYSLAGLLSAGTLFTNWFVESSPAKLDYPSYIEGGPIYFLTMAFLVFNVVISIFNLIRGIRKAKGYQKIQLSLFLASSSFGYLAGLPAYFLAFNIPAKPYTLPFVVLFPIVLSYAIIKHRFLDVRKLVKNTLIFSLLFILLLGFASATLFFLREFMNRLIGLPNGIAQAIAIAMALALYTPLKKWLSRITKRLLYHHTENPETIFMNLSEDMMRHLDSKSLLELVTQRIAEILSLHRISFFLKTSRTPYGFQLIASIGRSRKRLIPASEPIVEYLEKTRDLIIAPASQRERHTLFRKRPHLYLANQKEIKEEAIRELISLGGVATFPVFVNQNLRGILVIGPKKSDSPFRNEELEILKSFTRHLAFALANAEYAEKLKKSHEELLKNERDAFQGALIAGVAHEVKNPLYNITLSLTTLKANPKLLTETQGNVDRLISRTMTKVMDDVTQIKGIIEHLSTLADKKPLRIEEGINPFQIAKRVIQELKQAQNGFRKRVKIELNIPEDLRITSDPGALHEIFKNLIQNALEACPANAAISLEAAQKDSEVVIKVNDTGAGISPIHLKRIFEPFFTTKNGENGKVSGSGMGLFIVKENMESMGARIEVRSRLGKGTCFRLRFPTLESPLKEGI